MNQFLNEKHQFATPSLTPLNKFKSEIPPNLHRMNPVPSQGQTLILNINGTTNINNFHSGPSHGPSASLQQVDRLPFKPQRQPQQQVIQGRKNLPEPQLRVGQDQLPQKTMLPKKLLKQAKSAKNARITPKCIMQKTLKAAQQAETTGRAAQNKSQFDFNFNKGKNTIEYEIAQKRIIHSKKKSALIQPNKTQLLQQKPLAKNQTAKTSRSMAQTKQSKSFTKRQKSEAKKPQVQTNRPKTMINNLVVNTRQNGGQKPITMTSSLDVEKENLNNQNYSNEKKNGISISSFSSRSNKGRKGQDAIADQLAKNYFLNSKQLLKHISPTRIFDTYSKEPQSGLSQLNKNIRGRTRSIAISSNVQKPVQKRKNHSQSQTRTNQNLQTVRNAKKSANGSSRHETEDTKVQKSKSATLANAKTQASTSFANQNKKAVDKLIKENIRKNKNKQDEEQVRKQLEQYRQQQRKAELTQRNQEVRMMNASKIVTTQPNIPPDTMASPVSNRKSSGQHARRSQSCFDYQALRRNTAQPSNSGSRRAHHSQERQPDTKAQCSSKPRNFVDEIMKLTHQIEQEIGAPPASAKPIAKIQKKKPGVEENKLKKTRASIEIQKFIERKKRDEQVKRSLELTIEVDKQNKIQQNLNTLEKHVKKGIRQKSQPMLQRPKSTKSKSLTKKHKRSNAQQDSQIVGLSEIFHQNYKEEQQTPLRMSNKTQQLKTKHQTPSVLEEPSIHLKDQRMKPSYTNSGKQSFASTNVVAPRKAQNNSVNYHTAAPVEVPSKKRQLNKSFAPQTNTRAPLEHLAKKHPAPLSPKSTEQIRRIQELVGLYRCRLKPGLSDASVMGTLHSAASVIQYYFRYFKHLREADISKKRQAIEVESYIDSDLDKRNFNKVQKMGKIDVSQIMQMSDKESDFINTTDKRNNSVNEDQTIQNLDYWHPNDQDQFQQAFNQRNSIEGQVIASVFADSRTDSGQQTLVTSPNVERVQPQKRKPRQLDIEVIDEDQHTQQQPNSAFAIDSQNSGKGPKTPLQVPGLDLRQLREQQQKSKNQKKSVKIPEEESKIQPSPTDPPQTASSYSGIFNRLGLPLPRSARVKVEYSLVQRDPRISEQLKQVVEFKGKKGQQIMKEGLRDNLITERTYEINRLKLDKWVNASYNKIDENQASRRSTKIQTHEEMMQAAIDGRARLQKIINPPDERQSARSGFPSGRSKASMSGRGVGASNPGYFNQYPSLSLKGENYTDRDPYQHNNQMYQQNIGSIGSGRQQKSKLVELINRDSSRTSSKQKKESGSGSIKNQGESSSYKNEELRLEEIELNIDIGNKRAPNPNNSFEEHEYYMDNLNEEYIKNVLRVEETQGPSEDISDAKDARRSLSSSPMDMQRQLNKEMSEQHHQTEKSLNRSQSYQTIPKDLAGESIENLNQYSGRDDELSNNEKQNIIYPDQIERQLENALQNEKNKDNRNSPEISKKNSIEAIRDPHFFMRQVDDNGSSFKQHDGALKIENQSAEMNISEEKTKANVDDTTYDRHMGSQSFQDSMTRSPNTTQKLIKVENQQFEEPQSNSDAVDHSPPSLNHQSNKTQNLTVESVELGEAAAPGIPVSPMSDQPMGFESKIQTGAHSLSSTDSDMTKAIHAAHKEALDSPPDLISPKNLQQQMLQLPQQHDDKNKMADQITDYLLGQLLAEVNHEIEVLVPRQNLQRQRPSIKFFEKRGIKTDLFAIEKYVDEVLEEVKQNRNEFMEEINRTLSQDAMVVLFQMQNSEIGTYEHFSNEVPPVLSLDLYLKLEKRRKESRELATPQNPDGRFDFERVNEEELKEDGVDKNFLAECQHIHNKVLFDCINNSLQQFRPHGKEGPPMAWSRLNRKLKPTEDFTLEEMFEITKHDLFRMAIMQAGTLPRREFVFGGHFDEDLFAEIREKKLATLLCREIVDNEPQWLKWDFEEAQTKIDIADMVLESLVTETIGFLNQRQRDMNSAQAEFEKIQQMLQNKS